MAEFKGGALDGMRIRQLEKQRENELKEMNKAKEKLKEESKSYVQNINQKFESVTDQSNAFKNVGLISMTEFKKNIETAAAAAAASSTDTNKKRVADGQPKKPKKKTIVKNKLSFDVDDEQDEQENEQDNQIKKQKNDNTNNNNETTTTDENNDVNNNNTNINNNRKIKFGKDPTVNTDFLPDKERDELERLEREKLVQQWTEQQNKIKAEVIEITYSYWDGSGHRRTLQCTKGTTIDKFLDMTRLEFKELRGVSVDNLMFIKEDLIIPHTYSFYDMIVDKARGKSGPLFKFDVHEDIRLVNDATIEKDESHAGKVVEKSWYERNKHIFPASRWELYDRNIQRDKYTISDKLIKH